MGISMSSLGKGWPPTQLIGFNIETLHQQFMNRKIKNFDEFHSAILELFNTFNSALPGKHYDVPPTKEIEACFHRWKQAGDELSKRNELVDFMKKRTTLSKLDNSTLMTGILTPPAAMATKRAGESVPQLKALKAIPDVIFVPGFTILALVCAKLTRRVFQGGFADPGRKSEGPEIVGKKSGDVGPDNMPRPQPQEHTETEKVKGPSVIRLWSTGPTEVRQVGT